MRDILKHGAILLAITAVTALILAGAHSLTAGIIKENQLMTKSKAMSTVLPAATDNNFSEEVVTGNETGVTGYSAGYADNELCGFAISVTVNGYGGALTMLVGVDTEGVVQGIDILQHNETAGLGAKADKIFFKEKYIGKSGTLSVTKSASPMAAEVEAITAATITSKAVTDGVNLAAEYFMETINGIQSQYKEGGAN